MFETKLSQSPKVEWGIPVVQKKLWPKEQWIEWQHQKVFGCCAILIFFNTQMQTLAFSNWSANILFPESF